jgi:hypothetical protein
MDTEIKKRQTWLSIFTIEFLVVLLLLLALIVFIFAAREIFVLKNLFLMMMFSMHYVLTLLLPVPAS